MSVSPEEVERIAALARLQLTAEEVQGMSHQLSSILGHMDALARVEVGDAPALAGVTDTPAPVRRDSVGADELARPAAATAPDWREGFFVVPRLAALDADALAAESGSA
jgi:aspartyl-tRNA(Asn)/glutamyl-tRNA(Gln) amidotransferase subunit C